MRPAGHCSSARRMNSSRVAVDAREIAGRLPGIDLTSVRQDIPRMARQVVKSVVDRLDKPGRKPRDLAIRPTLTVRGTTAAPPS